MPASPAWVCSPPGAWAPRQPRLQLPAGPDTALRRPPWGPLRRAARPGAVCKQSPPRVGPAPSAPHRQLGCVRSWHGGANSSSNQRGGSLSPLGPCDCSSGHKLPMSPRWNLRWLTRRPPQDATPSTGPSGLVAVQPLVTSECPYDSWSSVLGPPSQRAQRDGRGRGWAPGEWVPRGCSVEEAGPCQLRRGWGGVLCAEWPPQHGLVGGCLPLSKRSYV